MKCNIIDMYTFSSIPTLKYYLFSYDLIVITLIKVIKLNRFHLILIWTTRCGAIKLVNRKIKNTKDTATTNSEAITKNTNFLP